MSLEEIRESNIMVDCQFSNDVGRFFSYASQLLESRLLALSVSGSKNIHQGDLYLKEIGLRAQNMVSILC